MVKCPKCREMLVSRDWEKNLKVCPRCNYHFKLDASERIELLVDADSFVEIDADIISTDPLHFVSRSQAYADKLREERAVAHLNEGVVSGHATIEGLPLALAVMDFRFIGGSMGSVVGEVIKRAIEESLERKQPIIIISASGGARMMEGVLSLMQQAKISAALAKLDEARVPYVSVLTDPTTGGVTAASAPTWSIASARSPTAPSAATRRSSSPPAPAPPKRRCRSASISCAGATAPRWSRARCARSM